MTKIFLLVALLVSARLFAQQPEEEIHQVLQRQQLAWNKGDIERFMSGYWQSDSLTFIGKRGVTKGWKQTLENYKKSYPDQSTMGELQFEIISIDMLSSESAYVTGKWNLKRIAEKGDIGGTFTLLFKKIGNFWLIVSDHSS